MLTSVLPVLIAGAGLLAMTVGFIGLGYVVVSVIRRRRRGRIPPVRDGPAPSRLPR